MESQEIEARMFCVAGKGNLNINIESFSDVILNTYETIGKVMPIEEITIPEVGDSFNIEFYGIKL